MSFRGNLCDISVTQLLNLINLASKKGTLVIEGPGEIVRVVFREGELAYAQIGHNGSSLEAILRHNQIITTNQYRLIKKRANKMTDKELGLLLINAGYVTQAVILESLQNHFIGIIQKLFTRVEGSFWFITDELPPEDKISVRINLENLIIEGSRQTREWEQIQEEIPNLDLALKFAERQGANSRKVNLNVEDWRVISFVNPKNSIRQIAKVTHMNDHEIRRVVYGLLQAGLVEFARLARATIVMIGRMFPTTDKKEQKSLLSRLIKRIRSL